MPSLSRLLVPSLILLASVLAGPVAAQPAEPAGLLLGLQSIVPAPEPLPYYVDAPDSLAAPTYQTLLLHVERDTLRLAARAPGLLLARDGRLWRAGVKRSVYNDWVEDFVWAAPRGERPTFTGIDVFNGEYCSGHRTQRLTYAGPQYLALAVRSTGYCAGAPHPWTYQTLAVVPLDSTAHLGLAISDVLGPEARRTLLRTTAAFLDTLDAAERERYLQRPDEANWALVRRAGRWTARMRLAAASEADAGVFADLPLPLALPPALTRQMQLPPAVWRAVRTRFPGARDAFLAPGGRFVAVLHHQRLTTHRLLDDGTRLGPVQRRIALAYPSTAVAVSDTGANGTARWQRLLEDRRNAAASLR